jgi:LmbE family N-acetylglucosaminyl deacetylase
MPSAGEAHAAIRAFPATSLHALLGGATPVVLAPHQDDETIGCGALIAAAAAARLRPRIVFITDGAGSHPRSQVFAPPRLAALREREAICAVAILGVDFSDVYFLRLPDTAAPHDGPGFDTAVAILAGIVGQASPAVIFAPWAADPHCDHLATHRMARTLATLTGQRHLSYPVWGWTLNAESPIEHHPAAGWRLPVAPHAEQRAAALAAHRSQTTDLIQDDPTGFRLDPATLARCWSDHESFLVNP